MSSLGLPAAAWRRPSASARSPRRWPPPPRPRSLEATAIDASTRQRQEATEATATSADFRRKDELTSRGMPGSQRKDVKSSCKVAGLGSGPQAPGAPVCNDDAGEHVHWHTRDLCTRSLWGSHFVLSSSPGAAGSNTGLIAN